MYIHVMDTITHSLNPATVADDHPCWLTSADKLIISCPGDIFTTPTHGRLCSLHSPPEPICCVLMPTHRWLRFNHTSYFLPATSTPFPAPATQFHDSGHLTVLNTDFNNPTSSLPSLRCQNKRQVCVVRRQHACCQPCRILLLCCHI
jgi:hypothetical protein